LISQTTEYALRAVVFLAMNPGKSHTVQDIAKVTKVPTPYLAKVLQALSKGQIVKSQRGLGGGFLLAKEPSEISVLSIVDLVDPIKRIHSCPLELAAHGVKLCQLHKRMDEAMAHVERCFAESNIQELITMESDSVPLCAEIPQVPYNHKQTASEA
jgi:Rrf2 family transcriptional regulator, nitric oxide-sensitive transcriptional repressor